MAIHERVILGYLGIHGTSSAVDRQSEENGMIVFRFAIVLTPATTTSNGDAQTSSHSSTAHSEQSLGSGNSSVGNIRYVSGTRV